MLDKPDIKDETLAARLRECYGISVAELEFLPLGHDWKAGVYRVRATDGATYLAKVRQEEIDEASVAIPQYLKDHGLAQVVAPLATRTNELWTRVDDFALLLYPFIEGQSGMMAGLTDPQWAEYGAVLRRIHATSLPDDLLALVPRETFIPNPRIDSIVKELLATIEPRDYADPYQNELAAFWNERRAEIQHLVARAQALGRALQAAPPAFVLCHADFHTANLLLDAEGRLFVIDWDQPIMAPKERDLLFVVDTPIGLLEAEPRQEGLFFQGYGATELDWLALAYYRYEWAVQDIGSFAELIFLREETSEETKAESLSVSRFLFQPGKIVDAAYAAEQHLPPELRCVTLV